ncbi:DUF7537 family lipoprotein [Halococcus saccharolyticus]|uniref:Lipoprotein n=1 Tax=Halococcus saccharolyticus DSM 5350 TaxID=1227455 RepID=M0MI70_9EURY|nr:hypothetical protein [Halococcus saccharolyticus]EMA45417.1 hypothetical protein C449_07330 [Halococcus saccharolyticus DSM 5350]
MDRSARVAAVLVLAVVLAGCNGLALGGDGTPTRTVTPAAVPTDEPTPTPRPELAPGLTGDGVVDPFALGNAHASILDGSSYTLHENSSVVYPSGMIYSNGTVEAWLTPDEDRYAVVRSGSQTSASFPVIEERFWSNGNRTLSVRSTTDETTYEIIDGDDGPLPVRRVMDGDPTNSERIATVFGAMETRVVGQAVRNGTRLYRVRGSNLTSAFALDDEWDAPGNVALVALVDRWGLVHEYRLNYTASLDGDPVRVSRRVRYTDLGSTTVERPSWYEAAVRNATTTTPNVTTTPSNGTDAPTTTATAPGVSMITAVPVTADAGSATSSNTSPTPTTGSSATEPTAT